MAEVRPLHVSAIDDVPDLIGGPEKPIDAGDPAAREKAVKETKSAEQIRKETVLFMMGNEGIRKYLFGVLNRCHLYSTPYSPRDPYATAFACGEHNIGLQVLADIQLAAPALYLKMLEENKNG